MRIISLLLSMCCLATTSFANTTVIFGDSYSDEGLIYALSGDTYPLPEPYFWEGRFSNGPVWTEFAFPDRANYAYGGAESNHDNVLSDPYYLGELADNTGLLSQVDQYIATEPANINTSSFIIYIGTNDVMQMLDPENPDPLSLSEVVANIESAAHTLQTSGAHHVTIFGLTDLSFTPWAHGKFSIAERFRLSKKITQLNAMLKKMAKKNHIAFYDANASFMNLIENASDYGFSDTENSCLDYSAGIPCENPDGYLFWDHIHPTTMAHQQFAKLYTKRLN